MLVPRAGRSFLVAVFLIAPLMALGGGLLFGLHLADQERADEQPAHHVVEEQGEQPRVVLPGGEAITLDQIAPGRKVAVVVMKDVHCRACRAELYRLRRHLSEIKRHGGTVVGLSDAPPCANQALMHGLRLNFPVVSDRDHSVLESVGMTLPERSHVMPGVIFLDESGEIEHIHRGRTPAQSQEQMIRARLMR